MSDKDIKKVAETQGWIGKAYNPVEEAVKAVGERLDRLYDRVDSIDVAINKNRMFYIDRFFEFSKHLAELEKKISTTNDVNKVLQQMLREQEASKCKREEGCFNCRYRGGSCQDGYIISCTDWELERRATSVRRIYTTKPLEGH